MSVKSDRRLDLQDTLAGIFLIFIRYFVSLNSEEFAPLIADITLEILDNTLLHNI